MNPTAAAQRAELRFRQVCCMVSGGPLAAKTVYREMQSVVPFAGCLHLWLEDGDLVDAYYNAPEVGKVLPLYADEYFRRAEAQVWGTTDQAAAGPKHLYEFLRISKNQYFRHPLYNEILGPAGAHTFIRSTVSEVGVPIASFSIGRGADSKDFSEEELETFRRIEPYVAMALTKRATSATTQWCDDSAALLITDPAGEIRWQSPGAETLLSLARGSRLAKPVLHEGILCAVHALAKIARGDPVANVPLWRSTNHWGHFSARPYWLDAQAPLNSLVGIVLERKVPAELQIIEGLLRSDLSFQQREIGHLLAVGKQESQIAQSLHLTRNTIVYHRRQLYNRLGVENRKQLIDVLVAR